MKIYRLYIGILLSDSYSLHWCWEVWLSKQHIPIPRCVNPLTQKDVNLKQKIVSRSIIQYYGIVMGMNIVIQSI